MPDNVRTLNGLRERGQAETTPFLTPEAPRVPTTTRT